MVGRNSLENWENTVLAGKPWRKKKRWLAGLLADEQAVGPLLKFLKSTEIGCKEATAQRELEWEQRRDQEGENQLDD